MDVVAIASVGGAIYGPINNDGELVQVSNDFDRSIGCLLWGRSQGLPFLVGRFGVFCRQGLGFWSPMFVLWTHLQ